MNLPAFSVRRPVFTTMATLIVILLGLVSLSRLPIDLMPDITYPTISIRTWYENAGPREIENLITRPIEQAVAAVPGVEEITGRSREGQSDVRVSFVWGTDLDAAANDLRDRLDRVVPSLPDDADRPMLRKYDLAATPILILGASSQLDPVQTVDLLENQVRYRIERLDGVAALEVWGGLDREIHVNLLPDRVKALGVPLDAIISRLEDSNLNLPAGVLESGMHEISIRTPGEFTSLEELGNTVVERRGDAVIRLRDVAEIRDSWQRVTSIARVNGKPGVRLSVSKQSGANTVQVAELVLAELAKVNQDIPQLSIIPVIDTSSYIKHAINNVMRSAGYGGAFAMLVLLFFLRNIRSTLIVAAAIPIAIIATFMLLYFGGLTLNLMTLGGLALGVGMLVDNAIVVLENIYRLRERGMDRAQAAIQGAGEMSGAIVASTLTTLFVFLPMLFIRSMAGIMFSQLAYVVGFSLLCSLVAALTVAPMLASKLMEKNPNLQDLRKKPLKRLAAWAGQEIARLENEYRQLLAWALRRRWAVVSLTLVVFGASLLLIPLIGVEMSPKADESEVRVYADLEIGAKLSLLDVTFRQIEAIVEREVPEAASAITMLGGSSWRRRGSHSGQMRIGLVEQSKRSRTSHEIAADLAKKLRHIPGAKIRTRSRQGLFVLRMIQGQEAQLEVDVRGYDLDAADSLAQQVMNVMESVQGVSNVELSRETGSPERMIRVDRVKAESMGVSVEDAARMLKTVLGGTRAGEYREAGDEYRIVVKVKDAEHLSLNNLLDMAVTADDGQAVVLRNLVAVDTAEGPVEIERKNQDRVITVEGDYAGRDLGSIIEELQEKLKDLPVAQGFSVAIAGDWEMQQKSFNELFTILILSLLLVYMVMACLYESLRDPFIVMFSVPLAVVGVSLMLFLTETTFNMQSYIGCIMLGGILVNNAILLVDQTNRLYREEGWEMHAAIEEAGQRRLRPILMTALTTMFGLLPLALGWGEGGETQAPMARAVIGGLASSTLITLIFVPVMYSLLASKKTPNTPDPS